MVPHWLAPWKRLAKQLEGYLQAPPLIIRSQSVVANIPHAKCGMWAKISKCLFCLSQQTADYLNLLVPKNVHFLRLAGSFIQRLKTENFRSSYLLVPEIKVLHTHSF